MWLVYRRLHGESVDDLQRQLHRRGLVRLRAEHRREGAFVRRRVLPAGLLFVHSLLVQRTDCIGKRGQSLHELHDQHERADVPAGKRVFWNSSESDDRANGVEVPPSVPAVHVRYVCFVAVVKFDCAESGKGQQGDLRCLFELTENDLISR